MRFMKASKFAARSSRNVLSILIRGEDSLNQAERGAVMVLFAMLTIILFGMIAIAID